MDQSDGTQEHQKQQEQKECRLELPKFGSEEGFVWPCNPTPDKVETGQWLEFLAANPCTCNPQNIDYCTCACVLDQGKQPRLIAMVRGNARRFKIRPESLEGPNFPMRLVYKCIHAAELVRLTQSVHKSMREFQELGSLEGVMSMVETMWKLAHDPTEPDDSGTSSDSDDDDKGKEGRK